MNKAIQKKLDNLEEELETARRVSEQRIHDLQTERGRLETDLKGLMTLNEQLRIKITDALESNARETERIRKELGEAMATKVATLERALEAEQ